MGTEHESGGCEMETEGESGDCEIENRSETVGIEVASLDESLETPIEGVAEGVGIQTGGAYVPQYNEHKDCNIEPEWEAFLDRYQKEIWNSLEDGFEINNEEEPISTLELEPTTDSKVHELHHTEYQEGIVDSDFDNEK
ncbi:hypothetical protein Adt_32021 [Abeliophyllum distichum]|uniref:Uncharacterized protein n=1 Tax=Abeliophyllum distichum TaxID=126358 RepID=A0ABD1RFU6_9LAMI